MSETNINKRQNEIEHSDTTALNVQVEGEKKTEHHHSHSGHRHHSGSHHAHHSGSHRHKSSKYSSKYRESSSSELERIGRSVIYESAKKNKINMFIKRFFFCAIGLILVAFVFASIINPDLLNQFSNIDVGSKEKEMNELKIRIIQYEEKIEELEAIIQKYENGELPE